MTTVHYTRSLSCGSAWDALRHSQLFRATKRLTFVLFLLFYCRLFVSGSIFFFLKSFHSHGFPSFPFSSIRSHTSIQTRKVLSGEEPDERHLYASQASLVNAVYGQRVKSPTPRSVLLAALEGHCNTNFLLGQNIPAAVFSLPLLLLLQDAAVQTKPDMHQCCNTIF